jgi:NADPH2:quinone reductase
VIGTTSSPEKAKIITEAGADHVLLTTTSSAENVKKVLELTDGKGVHVVYDGVGKDTWEEDFEVVRRLGTIVTFGNASVSLACELKKESGAEERIIRIGRGRHEGD